MTYNVLQKESRSISRFALLGALEFFIAGTVTLLISPDSKNAFFLGFSPLRIVMVTGIWVIGVSLILAGSQIRKRQIGLDSLWLVHKNRVMRQTVYALSFILIAWGWVALFGSPTLFGRRIYIFERLQPLSVAVGIVLMQGWFIYLYFHGTA